MLTYIYIFSFIRVLVITLYIIYILFFFRYRHGYCRHNPRKMVATWAEKEMRNLMRMHQAGMAVPKPLLLKGHVLVMDFVGTDGWPAPLLKNAEFNEEVANNLYLDCIKYMRTMYRDCRLVHAGNLILFFSFNI